MSGIGRLTAATPPTVLVLLSVLSVQVGAAFAKDLFPMLGPGGSVFLRLGFAALLLLAIWRPRIRGYTRANYMLILLFGIVFALMNSTFYASLERIPLGIAVAVEFVGPLGVAVFGSRRPIDLLWVGLAGAGIILLTPLGGVDIDLLGLALALVAGGCWAAYILLSKRVGGAFKGGSGLALSMLVGALLAAPLGIWQGGANLLDPKLLLIGAGVAMLSSVIPYSLELEALRKLPAAVFGVLMSTEPAVATLVGFAILGEALGQPEIAAIVAISAASLGSTYFNRSKRRAAAEDVPVEILQ